MSIGSCQILSKAYSAAAAMTTQISLFPWFNFSLTVAFLLAILNIWLTNHNENLT
jgi:hypothetical protein